MTKVIYAAYDDEGIYVYQAFKLSTVQAADWAFVASMC